MQNLITNMAGESLSPEQVIATGIAAFLVFFGLILDVIILRRFKIVPPDSEELGDRLKSRPWGAREGLCVLIIMVTFLLLGPLGIMLQIAGCAAIVSFMKLRGISEKEAFGIDLKSTGTSLKQGLLFYIAAVPLVVFYAYLSGIILEGWGFKLEQQEPIKVLLDPGRPDWLKIALVFWAVTVAPFIEELFFRGVMLPAMSKQMKPINAILLLSLVFAAIHCNVATLVPLFVISVAFSLGYLYSGSMLVPVIMHMLFNGVNLILLYLLKDSPDLL